MRRQAGVRDRLVDDGRRRRRTPLDAGVVAHDWSSPTVSRSTLRPRRVRGDPHREADQGPDADQPGEHALADGAEPAHAEAAVVGVLLQRGEVGDHVALGVRRHRVVGEGRHLLRTGLHGHVDVARLDALDPRSVAAAGHGAAGALEVVAGRAVGEEDLPAAEIASSSPRRSCPPGVVARRRDRRAGRQGGDERRQRLGSPPRSTPAPCAGPAARAGPWASGRCRPGRPRPRRRRRPGAGRSSGRACRSGPRRSVRGRTSSRPGTAPGPWRPSPRRSRPVRPGRGRTRCRASRSRPARAASGRSRQACCGGAGTAGVPSGSGSAPWVQSFAGYLHYLFKFPGTTG